MIHGSYEPGDALADVLHGMDETHHGSLGRVDPYGDALFNQQQAEAALREVSNLLPPAPVVAWRGNLNS